MELTSKYFTTDDKKLDKLDNFEIPQEWWSRPYEYYFASRFLNKNDVILDAGCGIEHPFKNYASKRVKKVYAVDADERIKDLKSTDKLEFINSDLTNLETIKDKTIDKVFCISVLEHLDGNSILATIKEFKRVLKDDGQIILTIDHPYLKSKDLVQIVDSFELEFVGSLDYETPKNVLHGPYNGLKTYSAILQKVQNAKELKINYETKELKPTETK
jgi:ubiquinone/menaquinone biosynthesis C-methylase UbiE